MNRNLEGKETFDFSYYHDGDSGALFLGPEDVDDACKIVIEPSTRPEDSEKVIKITETYVRGSLYLEDTSAEDDVFYGGRR